MTVIGYVDDLLIFGPVAQHIEDLIGYLQSKFKKITVHRGKFHSYLGMIFDFDSKSDAVVIKMFGYYADLVNNYGITKNVTIPANNNLFEKINVEPLLEKVSKALYTI